MYVPPGPYTAPVARVYVKTQNVHSKGRLRWRTHHLISDHPASLSEWSSCDILIDFSSSIIGWTLRGPYGWIRQIWLNSFRLVFASSCQPQSLIKALKVEPTRLDHSTYLPSVQTQVAMRRSQCYCRHRHCSCVLGGLFHCLQFAIWFGSQLSSPHQLPVTDFGESELGQGCLPRHSKVHPY